MSASAQDDYSTDHTIGFGAQAQQRHKFHQLVNKIARLMCEELDLDPDQQVEAPTGYDSTPWECGWDQRAITKERGPTTLMKRWRTYRRAAAVQLAATRATHQVLLEELS